MNILDVEFDLDNIRQNLWDIEMWDRGAYVLPMSVLNASPIYPLIEYILHIYTKVVE